MPVLDKVLLVDDDSTANFLHQLLLTKMNVAGQVLVAEDGQQALTLLAATPDAPPQLILLDINMPGMNGLEFLAAYQPPAVSRSVVVLLSSSGQSLNQVRLQALPADSYLEKPLTREKLAAVLAQHFAAGNH